MKTRSGPIGDDVTAVLIRTVREGVARDRPLCRRLLREIWGINVRGCVGEFLRQFRWGAR